MTFNLFENSRSKGRKVNLYLFRYGALATNHYAYTDHTSSVTKDGITYLPVPIKRGKIVVTGTMDKTALEVRTDLALPLAELFRVYPQAQVVSLIIREGHVNDPDSQFIVAWSGRVISAERNAPEPGKGASELIMTCEPLLTTLRRRGLRKRYQYSCNHVLYGPKCKANKAAKTLARTDFTISGLTITLPNSDTAFAADANNYLGGMLEWDNSKGEREYRTIIGVTKRAGGAGTNSITISGTLRDLTASTPISIVAGCSRTLEGCAFHNNTDNFGGCPYIPKKNPYGTTTLYY